MKIFKVWRPKFLKSQVIFSLFLLLGLLLWGKWVIDTHPAHAVVSWDEGFHGGSAFFLSETFKNPFAVKNYLYIAKDFINGLVWYLPLWSATAGILGVFLGPSVETYRLTTLIFAGLSVLIVAIFTKKFGGIKASIIAALTLACAPIFIVYSHLMMIEVPLLFSTTLALLFFYRYLTKEKITTIDYGLTVLALMIGTATKVTAVAIISGTVITFGMILFFFFRNTLLWKRFYSLWTIVFLCSSVVIFFGFCLATNKLLKVDMLHFYLGQTQQFSGDSSNITLSFIKTLMAKITYYLRDFSHMLPLAVIWLGSLTAFIICRRSPISLFLGVWVVASYLIFSSVQPQSPQYLLPIFAPLSIGVGLFWGDFFASKNKLIINIFFVFFIISLIWLNIIYLNKSEIINWRKYVTNQDQSVKLLVAKANPGDRIFSVGDGTRFLIQMWGKSKNLQTINGAASVCKQAIQDSSDWAISDYGPQNPFRLTGFDKDNWVRVASFNGSGEPTEVFRNINSQESSIIEGDNFSRDCPRVLQLGKNKILIYATTYLLVSSGEDNLRISLQGRERKDQFKQLAEIFINEENFKKQSDREQVYMIYYDQKVVNQQVFLDFNIPNGVKLKVRRIEIINLERNS